MIQLPLPLVLVWLAGDSQGVWMAPTKAHDWWRGEPRAPWWTHPPPEPQRRWEGAIQQRKEGYAPGRTERRRSCTRQHKLPTSGQLNGNQGVGGLNGRSLVQCGGVPWGKGRSPAPAQPEDGARRGAAQTHGAAIKSDKWPVRGQQPFPL